MATATHNEAHGHRGGGGVEDGGIQANEMKKDKSQEIRMWMKEDQPNIIHVWHRKVKRETFHTQRAKWRTVWQWKSD